MAPSTVQIVSDKGAEGVNGLVDWVHRMVRLVPRYDRVVFLSPPLLVAKFMQYALSDRKREVLADDPDARDPELVALVLDIFRVLAKHYFRLDVRGVDNVPREGPALLVGNHNGGFLPTDGFFTALAIHDRFGADREMYSLAHDFLFYDPMLRRYAMRMGALRAGHESARKAFDRGGLVLVYPGSDLETFRPFRDRNKIVLGGRTGFLSLAIRAKVPIVPVVSAGTHEQFIVLTRGERLARLLQAHRWGRTDTFPVVLSVPWGLTTGFMPYLPLPAQTTLAFGSPIRWPSLSPDDADDPDVLQSAYLEVESRMQALLDEISHRRRVFLGEPPLDDGRERHAPRSQRRP